MVSGRSFVFPKQVETDVGQLSELFAVAYYKGIVLSFGSPSVDTVSPGEKMVSSSLSLCLSLAVSLSLSPPPSPTLLPSFLPHLSVSACLPSFCFRNAAFVGGSGGGGGCCCFPPHTDKEIVH